MKTQWKILVSALKAYWSFKAFSRLSTEEKQASSIPDAFVRGFLDLGAPFIKLGQILSTRPDLLPAEYIDALKQLQEHVPPFGFETVRQTIETELARPLEALFKVFDQKPFASASLSQVHRAVLFTGEEVAVKIQRPGLKDRMAADLQIMGKLLSLVRPFNRRLFENLNIQNAFQEFVRYTLQELDFEREGKTYERFRQNFKSQPHVIFPKIYWAYTTSKILTMQKLSGMRLHEVAACTPPEQKKALARTITEVLMDMFIRDGFFHADLHPGNVFFGESGSIALIDVGMYGELTGEQRERFILYWLRIVLQQKRQAFDHLLKLTRKKNNADEAGFYTRYCQLLDQFYNAGLHEKSLTKTYLDILVSGAAYGFVFPSEMLLQAKALTTAEYIGYVLWPDFNFAKTSKPFITKAFMNRVTAENFSERLSDGFPEWFLLGETARPSLLQDNSRANDFFQKGGKEADRRWDRLHEGHFTERVHGRFSVEIAMRTESVFNFVTRLAQYPLWHPVYTPDSHVIHVSGAYIFITPQVVGSVFRLDEIVDGY